MRPVTSLRDTLLVARFELLRNLRTWRAIALCLLYVACTAGGAYIFVQGIGAMENAAAETLGVPATDKPGAMIERLRERGDLERMLGEMLPDQPGVVERVLDWPLMTMFHLWLAFILVPFLAVTTAAECIAVDLHNRTVRFECTRTGRLEMVFGRLLGQALLMTLASLLAVGGTWVVAMTAMVGNDPLKLLWTLLAVTPLVLALTLPFLGIGAAFSQLTSSPNVARVFSLGAVIASWILFGLAFDFEDGSWWWLWTPIKLVLPQAWMFDLWKPYPGWLMPLGVLTLLGFAYTAVAYPLFLRRDL